MKDILLHGAAVDATGKFCDAGRKLSVNDTGDENTIDAKRAAELVNSGRAVDASAEAADEFGDATVADLREIAEDEKIDLGAITRKDDIKAAIREARQQATVSCQEPLTPPEPTGEAQA